MKEPYKLDDDDHALDRFIERHYPLDPNYTSPTAAEHRALAATILNGIRATAEHVEDLPDEGQEIWRGRGMFRTVLLVVRNGIVRTVLPPGAQRPSVRRRAATP